MSKERSFGPVKWALFALLVMLSSLALGACSSTDSQYTESQQLEKSTLPIVQNQPVPNLGGYSLERDILSQLILLRNEKLATWTYMFQFGTLWEICPSMGYPIPYATQLTAPEVYYGSGGTVPQPEPNTLYSPDSADASWVLCTEDGLMVPEYYEDKVFAVPYRIKADRILERVEGAEGETSITMDQNKTSKPIAPDIQRDANGEPVTPTSDLTNPYPEDTGTVTGTDTISPTE